MSFAQSLAKALGPTPYSPAFTKEIKWRRERMRNGLAIDILLTYAGVKLPESSYPPTTRDSLLKLVNEIESGGKSRLYQSRALLYLFLDFSDNAHQGSTTTVAQYYATQTWISTSEQSLIKALWNLDHGRPEAALDHIGNPWDFEGVNSLHDYIVESLSDQRPGAVACYLASRGSPGTFNNELVKSLALKGKFAEVLDIVRAQQNPGFLKEITRAAVESKKGSLELVQLPCTLEEWDVINEELNHIIYTASPSKEDTNAIKSLAQNIILVRALYTGENEIFS